MTLFLGKSPHHSIPSHTDIVSNVTPPRTIVIATSSWQHGAAVPTHFKALADELAQRGHRVTLVLDRHAHELAAPHANPAVLVWPSLRPTRWPDFVFARRLFAQQRPDVLLANFGAVNVMTLAGWLTGVPTRIAWYHTMQAALAIDNRGSAIRRKLQAWRKQLVYRFVTHFVPVSRAAQEDLHNGFGIAAERCHVLYNPLHDPLPETTNDTLKESVSASVAPAQVLCVGRFDPVKGQDVLLRALPRLRAEFPALRVVFVGDGALRNEYQTLAQTLDVADNCVFHGNATHDEVLKLLRNSTLSVVPSRSDNCPLTVIESLACGTPLVASRVGGIPELFDDGSEGFLVPPDDPDTLAERIGRLLRDATLRQTFSANARQRFLTRYEMQHAVKHEADWLEQLAQSTHAK